MQDFWPLCVVNDAFTVQQVGAGGLDAAVPTGTVIGLFDDADEDGCLVDYGIDDADVQVRTCSVLRTYVLCLNSRVCPVHSLDSLYCWFATHPTYCDERASQGETRLCHGQSRRRSGEEQTVFFCCHRHGAHPLFLNDIYCRKNCAC